MENIVEDCALWLALVAISMYVFIILYLNYEDLIDVEDCSTGVSMLM